MTPAELNREIESGKFKPVYYFYGSEDYRMKEAEKKLVSCFLPKSLVSVNHITLTAAKGKLQDILNELAVVPMLGERQVFTINDIQSLVPSEVEKILSLLSPPDPNRVVILVTPAAKYKKDAAAIKLLIKKTAEVEFGKVRSDVAERKIVSTLAEHKIEIDREAVRLLLELSAGDMGGLTEEINKLINYAGEGGKISREDVACLSADYQAFKVFELGDYVAAGDFDRALAMLENMLNSGEKESGVFFWLSNHFQELYFVKNEKPLPPFRKWMTGKYRQQAARFDNAQVEDIILLLSEADRDLRGNIKPEKLVLERLILNICRMSGKKA